MPATRPLKRQRRRARAKPVPRPPDPRRRARSAGAPARARPARGQESCHPHEPDASDQLAFVRFCEALAAGELHRAAVRAARREWRQISQWIYLSRWFKHRYELAREQQALTRGLEYEDVLDTRIRKGVPEPVIFKGEVMDTTFRHSDRLLALGLSANSSRFDRRADVAPAKPGQAPADAFGIMEPESKPPPVGEE